MIASTSDDLGYTTLDSNIPQKYAHDWLQHNLLEETIVLFFQGIGICRLYSSDRSNSLRGGPGLLKSTERRLCTSLKLPYKGPK